MSWTVRHLATVSSALLVLGSAACANRADRGPRIPDSARTADRIPQYRPWSTTGRAGEPAPVFQWSRGTVLVENRLVDARPPAFHRLMVVSSDGTTTDEFMVDTGAMASTVSMSSPIARGLRFGKTPSPMTIQRHPTGHEWSATEIGVLPSLRLGDVEGHDLVFFALSEPGSRVNPRNLLGLDTLQRAALVRDGGHWSVETGTRAPWPGVSSVPLARLGLSVVSLRDATGRTLWALIDTGAQETIAFPSAGTAPWTLYATDGRALLSVSHAVDGGDVSAASRTFGGFVIDIAIGLDVLDRGTWRIDFERGVWEFT